MAPKTFKRRQERRIEAGGCMNCTDGQEHQLWEASEGMVHLLAEFTKLAKQDETGQSQERLDKLAASLPNLARAFDCSQFRQGFDFPPVYRIMLLVAINLLPVGELAD